jgi:hypothetical protein
MENWSVKRWSEQKWKGPIPWSGGTLVNWPNSISIKIYFTSPPLGWPIYTPFLAWFPFKVHSKIPPIPMVALVIASEYYWISPAAAAVCSKTLSQFKFTDLYFGLICQYNFQLIIIKRRIICFIWKMSIGLFVWCFHHKFHIRFIPYPFFRVTHLGDK